MAGNLVPDWKVDAHDVAEVYALLDAARVRHLLVLIHAYAD